ncbi:MAG TPA: MFS transporter [Mycobacteriales bacterium]|nr:MFS transporter [Mycobacteriales bacterium]
MTTSALSFRSNSSIEHPSGEQRESWVLSAMCLCTVLVVGFVASINLAVPKLAASSLHPSGAGMLWIVDAYVVVFAGLVILGGAIGDRYGRKGLLLVGLAIFATGAAISAAAPDVAVMVAGRALTGVGAAAVLPNSLAVILHTSAADRRPAAIAAWASMTGIGGVVGNLGGGLALTAGSWRWLFVVAAACALGCLALSAVVTPVTARHDRHLDPIAAGLLTGGSLALLVGIIEGPQRGWTSLVVIAGFIAAVVLLGAWCGYELRQSDPLLDPRVFVVPRVGSASVGMFIVFFGMFALFYLNASFLQYDHGFGLVRTGLAVLPLTAPMILGARRVPAIQQRIGLPPTIGGSFALVGGGLLGLATAARGGSYLGYAAWLVVLGLGIMLALPTLTSVIATSLPPDRAGVSSGLQATTRELGSALGVAVVGSVLNARFAAAVHSDGIRSVGQALAATTTAVARRHVVNVYAASVAGALAVVGVIVLCAGVLVTGQAVLSGRRGTE